MECFLHLHPLFAKSHNLGKKVIYLFYFALRQLCPGTALILIDYTAISLNFSSKYDAVLHLKHLSRNLPQRPYHSRFSHILFVRVCLVFHSYLISQPAAINQYFLTRALLSLRPNKKSVSHKQPAGPCFSLMKVVIVLQLKQTESVFAHALVSLSLMRGLFQHHKQHIKTFTRKQ